MHILHVYKDYFPVLGGIENHVKALAEAQTAAGHQVTVLVCNRGPRAIEEKINGVRVIKVGRVTTLASMPISPGFPRALRSLRPDITHLQAPYPAGEVAQWLAGQGRPYVVSYQADVTRPEQRAIMRVYNPLFRRILRGAGRVLATSPNFAASSPYLRAVAERVCIVPLGIDVARFAPARAASAARPFTLLFVGALRHYKGVDDLICALPHLSPKTRLLLAGDGPKRVEWETLGAALGLRERVTFLGQVGDDALPGLYHSADMFALPSNSPAESFGTVLVEAMASGLPCVTTEVGSGTSYVVQHNVTGFVVPPRSPEALADALQRLAADAALRARMGAAGRERALREFTLETMVRRVEEVYREVLESRKPSGAGL